MEKIKKENKNSTKFSRWLDSIDEKAAKKGAKIKLLWQIAKFCIVSLLVSAIQLALVNLLFFCMKSWVDPLPGFLGDIFNEETMGPGHSNWGYILPFFLSNIIANTVGYFLNKHKTFKSNSPWWHYVIYIVFLFVLILFTTWVQGLVANLFIKWGVESLGPTIASMTAGTIQMLLLFPLQKWVLLREKHEKSRLSFRKITEDDAQTIFNGWASNPEVTKYVTWEPHESVETTKQLVSYWVSEYDKPYTYRYGIIIKKTNELIGMIDVVKYHEGVPEIGYCISQQHWNKGYTTESTKMLIDILFKDGYSKILIDALEVNVASNRVIQKCGFKFVSNEVINQGKHKDFVLNHYELTKED